MGAMASWTTFTVGDAATGVSVHGGPGSDTVIGDGFAFTVVELTIMGDAGVESVLDANGLHLLGG